MTFIIQITRNTRRGEETTYHKQVGNNSAIAMEPKGATTYEGMGSAQRVKRGLLHHFTGSTGVAIKVMKFEGGKLTETGY